MKRSGLIVFVSLFCLAAAAVVIARIALARRLRR